MVLRKKRETQKLHLYLLSGYQDSNLGPPAPKAGALTGLRYIPFLLMHNALMHNAQLFAIRHIFMLSGYQDSNLGPPAPKAGALTGLRYIPKNNEE